MTIREFKRINKQISKLERKLERLKAEAVNSSPSLSGMPGNDNVSDKIGKCVAEIADVEKEISKLSADRNYALGRLSADIDEENCIYLFLVKNYTWEKIAQIADGRPDTADSIRMRCAKHQW